jgi:uncharacterized protein
MTKLPCEEAIWYVLPRIRADLARQMVNMGLSQKEVALKLQVTPAAVSQYLNRKRGNVKKSTPEYNKKILKRAKNLIKSEDTGEILQKTLCELCTCTRCKK